MQFSRQNVRLKSQQMVPIVGELDSKVWPVTWLVLESNINDRNEGIAYSASSRC